MVAKTLFTLFYFCSTCADSIRHIIWLPHESHAGMSLPKSKSLKVHFGLRGYAPETIAVKRGFNACQTHRSIYPSIFNRFPVIQPESPKVRHFSTFFAHFDLPWVRPWDNRGKVTWIEREINACQSLSACTHISSTVSQ